MSLIVEDGTGLANAESYISVVDATAYHANRGNAAWASLSSDTVREQCLRKATDYMLQTYRNHWKGWRVSAAQALDWPRQNVLISDAALAAYVAVTVVPTEVKNACAELALRASVDSLAPDQDRKTSSETVGPISVTYERGTLPYVEYRAVDNALKMYLKDFGVVTQLIRA